MSDISQRIKEVRTMLGCTQQQMVQEVGCALRSWQDHEAGRSLPRGETLMGLLRMGVDVNWLLSGKGDMRYSEGRPLDDELLHDIIEVVEEAILELDVTLPPEKKADLILTIYRFQALAGKAKPVEYDNIIQFVRMAS